MSRPTIMRRHRYRLTGDDIAAVATALVTATEIDAAENSAVLQQVASHINPHARGDDGYGQLIGDDAGACLSRAAVVSQFANTPVAGLDVFVLNNGHDDRHINAILWVSVGAPANTFPVYPFASFAGCTGVSKRSAGISPVTEPVAYGSHFGTFQGGPSTQDRALSGYLLGDITDTRDEPIIDCTGAARGLWSSGAMHAPALAAGTDLNYDLDHARPLFTTARLDLKPRGRD